MTPDPDVQHSVQLSVNLLVELYKVDENLIFSPYSLVMALVMVLLGASGNSKQQLVKVIFEAASRDADVCALVCRFVYVDEQIRRSSKTVMQMGNLMYSSIQLNPRYQKKLTTDFNATSKKVNFGDPTATLNLINDDVSQATAGLITNLFDQLDPDTVVVLVNVLYFKGMWLNQFDKKNTREDGIFCLTSGQEIKTAMMFRKGKYVYFEEDSGLRAIMLEYSEGGLALVVIMPPERVTLAFLSREPYLTAALVRIMVEDNYVPLHLTLPRFKLSSTHHLVNNLKGLGIEDIFKANAADLSDITDAKDGLYVSDIVQKAAIEVNEEGTEAAAATGLEFTGRSMMPGITFTVDRPFFFGLVHLAKKQVLFLGAVEDPSKG